MGIVIGAARFSQRLSAAQSSLREVGATALLVGVGPELEWLTGYEAHGLERLSLLVVPADAPPRYLSPTLERDAALAAPGIGPGGMEVVTWADGEDPYRSLQGLLGTARPSRLLVSDRLRAAFLLGLQATFPDCDWALASTVLSPLRRVKDEEEIALLRAAAAAADRAVERILAGPLVGRTEAEVARDVREALVDEGHDHAEFAIVASGPNTASPHHEPNERVIDPGEPLLLDIGGRRAGYVSDITRTVWIGGADGAAPDAGFAEVYELVRAAQAAARMAVRPGVTFGALDAAARDIISAGGHGGAFIHRLGHGIGLEAHEEPYAVAGNDEPVVIGNTFSCEPGVYLGGRFGVRIEDVVACSATGADTLNTSPRELRVVAGR